MGDDDLIDRRTLLVAVAATSWVPGLTSCSSRTPPSLADPVATGVPATTWAALAKSYAAAAQDPVDRAAVSALFPRGMADLPAIRAAVSADFAAGRMFVHRGWRLSHTEGRLYTLLDRAHRASSS